MKDLLPLMFEMRDAVIAAFGITGDECGECDVRWCVHGSAPDRAAVIALEIWRDQNMLFEQRFSEGQIRVWLADREAPGKLAEAIRFLVRERAI